MHIDGIESTAEIVAGRGKGASVELRLRFPSTRLHIRAALDRVMSGLGAMHLTDDDASTVELVLAEVLNNVSRHAYADDPHGVIELHLIQTGCGLSGRVIDEGIGMPCRGLPPGIEPDPCRPLDQLAEGGFGWFLIHRLTRNPTYMRVASRNVFWFGIDVGQPVSSN